MEGTSDDVSKILTVPKVAEAPNKGLGATIFEKMQENKGLVAQIDGITGEKDSYDSLLQRSVRAAIAMRLQGITSEDIVSICSFNHLDVYVPFLAGLFLGCKLANLDPTLSVPDTVHLLNQVRPKIIFVGPEATKLIEDAVREAKLDARIVAFGNTPNHLKFSDFLVQSPEEANFKPVEVANVKETALIFFSSGTTGLPKGICISHHALLSQAFQTTAFFTKRAHVILVYSSLFWSSSAVTLLSSFLSENCFVNYPNFDPTVWNTVEKCKVTVMGLAASRLLATCKSGPPEGKDVSSLKLILITGTTMSKQQIEVVRQMVPGALVANTYGLTEVCGAALSFRPASNPEHIRLIITKANSCGTTMPGFSYKIVNPETEDLLGQGEEGELRLKSDFQMNGYYNIDSSDCWDADGWLKTGDVAYYDEDLCFYIVDRVKEIFKYQCYQVVPARIEAVLLGHPDVRAAIVVPLPHEEDGNHPVGVVALNSTATGVTANELENYVKERVPENQSLRGGVKIIDAMPLTPSGKVKRGDVVKMVREGTI